MPDNNDNNNPAAEAQRTAAIDKPIQPDPLGNAVIGLIGGGAATGLVKGIIGAVGFENVVSGQSVINLAYGIGSPGLLAAEAFVKEAVPHVAEEIAHVIGEGIIAGTEMIDHALDRGPGQVVQTPDNIGGLPDEWVQNAGGIPDEWFKKTDGASTTNHHGTDVPYDPGHDGAGFTPAEPHDNVTPDPGLTLHNDFDPPAH